MSCAIADTQITTTSNGGCKNRSRIDMEIRPKQQDTALNLLVKTPRFSQTCAGRELLPVAQGHPSPLPRPGSRSSPTLSPQRSKIPVPLNPSSAQDPDPAQPSSPPWRAQPAHPAVLCGAGGCPRHWQSQSVILFLLLSCATTRNTQEHLRGDLGGQNTPARFPLPLL